MIINKRSHRIGRGLSYPVNLRCVSRGRCWLPPGMTLGRSRYSPTRRECNFWLKSLLFRVIWRRWSCDKVFDFVSSYGIEGQFTRTGRDKVSPKCTLFVAYSISSPHLLLLAHQLHHNPKSMRFTFLGLPCPSLCSQFLHWIHCCRFFFALSPSN